MKNMWCVNALACSVLLAAMAFMAPEASANDTAKRNGVIGCWKTIDDKTKKPKSIVRIKAAGSSVSGHILKLFRKPSEDQDPKCDKCKGARKGKRIIGMNILWGLKAKDWWWKGGKILDPANGKVYRAELWLNKKGADRNKLKVRGFIAFFFRTQTWHKTACPAPAKRAPAKRAAKPAARR